MANYFLASVGVANAFVKKTVNGVEGIYHAFTAKTLTESTLGFTSTQEEVRAGQGAQLMGRFNHDTGLTVSLTDAMFKLEYLAMQVGSEIDNLGATVMTTETLVYDSENDGFELKYYPAKMGSSCGMDKYGVWFREAGCESTEEYHFVELDGGASKKFTSDFAVDGKKYCVTYFKEESGAREMLINANFIPSEMVLILTTKLFAGDANNPESGKPVGEITIKIPRFQLDGQLDLSMAMSSAATISLNGTALSTGVEDCSGNGVYAEIVEFVSGRKWYDGIVSAIYSSDDKDVYAVYANGDTNIIPWYVVTPESGTPTATSPIAGLHIYSTGTTDWVDKSTKPAKLVAVKQGTGATGNDFEIEIQ